MPVYCRVGSVGTAGVTCEYLVRGGGETIWLVFDDVRSCPLWCRDVILDKRNIVHIRNGYCCWCVLLHPLLLQDFLVLVCLQFEEMREFLR